MDAVIPIFCISFCVALSGALMPGPLLAAVVSESLDGSSAAGLLISSGHAALEAVLLAGLVFGLEGILTSVWSVRLITVAGSAFLIWSGVGMLAPLKTSTGANRPKRRSGPALLVWKGIALSATNPYWLVWWMTVGLGLALSSRASGIAGISAFFTGHILADTLWFSSISLAIARKRSLFSGRAYSFLLAACGLSLIGFGLFFLIRSPFLSPK